MKHDKNHRQATSYRQHPHKQAESAVDIILLFQVGLEIELWEAAAVYPTELQDPCHRNIQVEANISISP